MDSGQFPRIDGFAVTGELGAGGAGAVYLAVQQALGRQVALKVLTSAHPTALPRFRREAAVMSKLSHPGLVRLYDHGIAGETPWLAMEYVPGGSLRDRMGSSGPGLGGPFAARLARELLEVLTVLHDAGLLHRDIKPSNILIRESGQAVLADLGLVRQEEAGATRLTKAGQLIGTVAYLAPEALAKGELTRASDLFAVGAVLYEVLTGQVAGPHGFPADFEPPDPAARCSDCPANLRGLVMELMAGDPAKRPESAAAALRKLRETRKSRIPATSPPAGRGRSRAVPALIAGALVGLGAYFVRGAPEPLLGLAAAPTAVTLELAARGDELSVSVFDTAGKPAGSRLAPAGPRASVTIGGLEPGTAYTATVFRPGAAARVLARRDFTTAAEVRVHGAEPREPVLWMSANPTVTFTAGASNIELGAAPTAVTLGRERGPFSVRRAGAPPVTIELKLPPAPPPADHKLGVCVPADRDLQIREGGSARPVWDWVRRHDIRTVSLLPRPDGAPALGADFISSVARGGRVAVVPRVHPRAAGPATGKQGWEADLDAPLFSGLGPLSLGVRFDWLTEGFDQLGLKFREELGALYVNWDPYLAAHHPRWKLIRGAQLRELMVHPEPLGPAIDPATIQEVEIPFDADSLKMWLGWSGAGLTKYRVGHLDSAIRSVTINFEREDDPNEVASERGDLSMIRQLVLARRFFPGATVTIDLLPRLMKANGELRPVWAGFEAMARLLAGVDGASSSRSLATATTALAAQFTAGPRRITVFFADRERAPATFTPERAGVLRALKPASFEPGPARFVDAPVTVELGTAPQVFEELLPVAASSAEMGVVSVTP